MRVNFVNAAAENILGKKSVELVGRSLEELQLGLLPFFTQVDAQTVDEEVEEIKASRAAGDVGLSTKGNETHRSFFVHSKNERPGIRLQQCVEIGKGNLHRIIRGDVAELLPEAGLGKLLDREAAGGRVLLFQDVTKLLHLEEKLKQNEKLAAVGQLAAGIAHEIRNPLASTSAAIELLKGSLQITDPENQKLMDIALREIDRLNRLLSEFLDFVKPVRIRFEQVRLNDILAEVVMALRRSKEIKPGISILDKFASETLVYGNPEKLKQVAWNLLLNAIQAVSASGAIEIGCSCGENHTVLLWIEDNGCGMSDEIKAHLYEPFFTTKDKGTGLGLATVYKIVEAHHGEIRVISAIGKGTRIEIILPSI
ncbi:MAG: hypothetical protein HY537_18135 [Deltaproteobacteria bacterium]|nr:hypothetical protein [Deltaproteobacteria bacterium]